MGERLAIRAIDTMLSQLSHLPYFHGVFVFIDYINVSERMYSLFLKSRYEPSWYLSLPAITQVLQTQALRKISDLLLLVTPGPTHSDIR